jgi:hypothetical protein
MAKVPVCFFFLVLSTLCLNAQQDVNSDNKNYQTEIKVFPKPATNVVNLLGLENSSKADILISDISGNIIQKYRWEIRNHALNIPIALLKAGIERISISSKEQSLQTKFYNN